LYHNKFSKSLERAECTSAVCDNTAVVSQRNWLLSVSRSVHKRCINSYNSCIRTIMPFRWWRFRAKVTHCSITTVVSQQIIAVCSPTCNAKMLHKLIQPLCRTILPIHCWRLGAKAHFQQIITKKSLANCYRKSVNSFIVFDKDEAA